MIRSGELAAAAGVNPQTLRYYERRGLLPSPDRSLGGHRLYPPDTVTLLRVIKTAQRLGFTLDEVGAMTEGGLRSRAADKLAAVEARIAGLRAIADTLREAVAAGCDDLDSCAADDRCPLPF
ncbi:MerR family transcriptional regulator [Actinoplanes friuliensis]|uniref:MerR family transcriptional regulator n=1 Tax=Actinoplanes friuliensis DSM 7358 TaxID=1246995 RepID=U5WAP3_9ACTN|nr:MerR family transcriptional regulator [Actinoplanes friuliensis]AGZ45026.1 MerR family transcriptional regulator [Actinoplanes friuliensis DSM 7358]